MTVVAAFDLATATGVCHGEVGAQPKLSTWHLDEAGDNMAARWHALAENINAFFASTPCDKVYYEMPLILSAMKRLHTPEPTIAFLRGAIGVLGERCHASGKSFEGVDVQDARESVLGWRTNDRKKTKLDTKKRVMADIRLLGVRPATQDEADAAVVWFYSCAKLNPRLAAVYTPLFRRKA